MASFDFADETILSTGSNEARRRFDDIIGAIEEIVISHEFQAMQEAFMERHYLEFEDTEENKFVYMDIFREYGAVMERHLVAGLQWRIPEFSMAKFAASLQAHKAEITDEIFDMFVTFTDFLAFKEMFLDYRADKEGRNVDLMGSVVVHSIAAPNPSVVTSS